MRTDYEEALLRVSDALRSHNKPAGGISSREACEDILEAVRPKGEWRFDSIGCYCSKCKKHPDVTTDYCPFCGADLREV